MAKNKSYFHKFKISPQGFMLLVSVFALGLILYFLNTVGFNMNYNSRAGAIKPKYIKVPIPAAPTIIPKKSPNKTPDIRPYLKN